MPNMARRMLLADRPNHMEPEDRFRDRRGREHYDNGRFAPMRGNYDSDMRMGDEPEYRRNRMAYDEPETRRSRMGYEEPEYRRSRMAYDEPENRRYRRYNNGRFAPRSEYGAESYMPSYAPPVYEEDDSRMRTIGFSGAESRWDEPRGNVDVMNFSGRVIPMRGGASHVEKFDKHMADEWMAGIKNEDGRQGPRWSEEQTKQVMKQRGIDCDPLEFYVAMNLMYADYGKVFSKYGMGDRTEFYADMAKAFIDDKDAVDNKLAMYYEYIVEN